jgi:peptide/nickel transport system permease protein
VNGIPSITQPNAALTRHQNQWQIVWRQYKRHKLALAGMIILLALFLIAALAPVLAPYNPNAIDLVASAGEPAPPGPQHWFGTDDLGRDWLSRALYGARVSLSVGFVAMVITVGIGIVIGTVTGHYGGWADSILMRVTDVFMSVPSFFLILAVNAYIKPSIYNTMIVIGIFSWMGVARLVRGQILSINQTEYIVAAHVVGVPARRLMIRHLVPNAFAPVIVAATLTVATAILIEAGLSFLGMGVPQPTASWGNMLQAAQPYLDRAWWMSVIPGLLISITVLCFNFVGDGLRDSLDPTLKR